MGIGFKAGGFGNVNHRKRGVLQLVAGMIQFQIIDIADQGLPHIFLKLLGKSRLGIAGHCVNIGHMYGVGKIDAFQLLHELLQPLGQYLGTFCNSLGQAEKAQSKGIQRLYRGVHIMVGLGAENQCLNILDHTEFAVVKVNALLGDFRIFCSAQTFKHSGSTRQGAGKIDVLGCVVLVLPVLMILTGKYQERISGLHNCRTVAELVQELPVGDNKKLKVVFVSVHIGTWGSPNVKG